MYKILKYEVGARLATQKPVLQDRFTSLFAMVVTVGSTASAIRFVAGAAAMKTSPFAPTMALGLHF